MDNQRWNERVPYRLRVVLHYPALGLIMGRTRNISEQGMFVETPCEVDAYDERINVTFTIPTLTASTTTQVSARVVHRADGGLGLFFDNIKLPLVS